jgi:hypothetical protein
VSSPRGVFVAIGTNTHNSKPLYLLRRDLGSLADAYFYRMVQWVKEYRQSGCVRDDWEQIASWIAWPDGPDDLAGIMRRCGVVEGSADKVFDWEKWNGWLLEKRRKDNDRKRKEYEKEQVKLKARQKGGRAAAAARKAKALSLAQQGAEVVSQVGGSVGSRGGDSDRRK